MPSAVSVRPEPRFAARCTVAACSFPEAAATGETSAARLAGACAASSTGAQTSRTQPEYRCCRKLATDAVSQRTAHRPTGKCPQHKADRNRDSAPAECFHPDKTDDLLFAHSETAHHTKEPGALRNIAVHEKKDFYTAKKADKCGKYGTFQRVMVFGWCMNLCDTVIRC